MTAIRKATQEDLEAVMALAKSFTTSFVIEEAAFQVSYSELLASPDAYLAVAEQDGRIIGYLIAFDHYTFYANGRVSWVEEIIVDEQFRRYGIGQMLMDACETWAASRGSKLVALATRRAAPFYLALGYQESATYFRKML